MKLKVWLTAVLIPLTAYVVAAQPSSAPPPPAVPPPATSVEPTAAAPSVTTPVTTTTTNSTAATKAKKKKAKKVAKATKTTKAKTAAAKETPAKSRSVIVLNPPVMASVKCEVLDVRGQGSFAGEVIGHVKKGDTVTVLEEITLSHAHSGEPAQWSRILMPTNIGAWVAGQFISSENKTVRVKKVNLRSGPGENYSVVGGLEKGTAIEEIGRKSGWIKIASPTNAFAFVASEYLEPKSGELAANSAPPTVPTPAPQTAPQPSVPTPPQPVQSAPVVVNVPPPEPTPAAPKAVESTPAPPSPSGNGLSAPAPTPASQADQELAASHPTPPPTVAPKAEASVPATGPAPMAADDGTPRVVTREGYVKRSYNIQSPTAFALHDIKTGEVIEFLEPPPRSKFKAFLGTRVRATGAEYFDARWPRTPILKVELVNLMP
jgi:hypothetical protein